MSADISLQVGIAEAPAPPPAAAGQPIGVVIVHGVGSQPQTETLRWFADPLVAWLRAWHDAHPSTTPGDAFRIEAAHFSHGGGLLPGEPARIALHLPAFHAWPARRWVVAEAWWATRVHAPGLRRMTTWALRSFLTFYGTLLRQILDRAAALLASVGIDLDGRRVAGHTIRVRYDDPRGFGALVELAHALVLLGTYVLTFVPVLLAITVLYVLARIPIPPLQEFIVVKLLSGLLVDNIGDFVAYVDDEPQALHIRRGLEEVIDWLVAREGCERVIVVGHSQGTVVAFDALAHLAARHRLRVTKLVTVGSALNNAWRLVPADHRLQRATLDEIYWLDVWSFYDFIQVHRLQRPNGVALTRASAGLRQRMRWDGQAPRSARVVNRMNARTEHGGYWMNREEVLARIAGEIDEPDRDRWDSRFFFADETNRIERRRLRVTTLTLWRLAAIAAFFGAVVARWLLEPSVADVGRAARALLALAPGVDGALNGAVAVLDAARATLGAWVEPEAWTLNALAVAVAAVAFQAAHVFLARVLYDPWDRAEGEASLRPAAHVKSIGQAAHVTGFAPDIPPIALAAVWLRSAFAILPLAGLAWLVAAGPSGAVVVVTVLAVAAALLAPASD